MSTNFETTSWPSTPLVPNEVKDLLAHFFKLIDEPDPNAGKALSEEVFTDDAIIQTPVATFTGKSEISTCRATAWDVIRHRHHAIERVCVAGPEVQDIVCVGILKALAKDGTESTAYFVARFNFEEIKPGVLRIKFYQAFVGKTAIV